MSQQNEPLQVNLCANCFRIVERYQDPKEILRQLKKKGCSRCKLIAYANIQREKLRGR